MILVPCMVQTCTDTKQNGGRVLMHSGCTMLKPCIVPFLYKTNINYYFSGTPPFHMTLFTEEQIFAKMEELLVDDEWNETLVLQQEEHNRNSPQPSPEKCIPIVKAGKERLTNHVSYI